MATPIKITYERLRRAQVIEAFSVAFQMIGGVPRLALWADQNPDEFYKLYGRLLPASTSQEMSDDSHIVIEHALPPPRYDPLGVPALEAKDVTET